MGFPKVQKHLEAVLGSNTGPVSPNPSVFLLKPRPHSHQGIPLTCIAYIRTKPYLWPSLSLFPDAPCQHLVTYHQGGPEACPHPDKANQETVLKETCAYPIHKASWRIRPLHLSLV